MFFGLQNFNPSYSGRAFQADARTEALPVMHIEHFVALNVVRASINMPNLYGILAETKRMSFKGYSSGFYWPGGTKIGI